MYFVFSRMCERTNARMSACKWDSFLLVFFFWHRVTPYIVVGRRYVNAWTWCMIEKQNSVVSSCILYVPVHSLRPIYTYYIWHTYCVIGSLLSSSVCGRGIRGRRHCDHCNNPRKITTMHHRAILCWRRSIKIDVISINSSSSSCDFDWNRTKLIRSWCWHRNNWCTQNQSK